MKNKRLKSAFTIIELLISLTVIGMVLTAAAIAFDACIANYQAGKDMSDANMKASQALSRITADLRCADAVVTSEPNSQCTMITAAGGDITYKFEQSDEALYLVDNDTATSYTLCEGISSAFFDRITDFNDLGVPYVKSVQIKMTIQSGSYSQNYCAGVAIRKNFNSQ